MSVRVEVVCIAGDGSEQRREVMTIERRELAMETLGLTLKEGKALESGRFLGQLTRHSGRPTPRLWAGRRDTNDETCSPIPH